MNGPDRYAHDGYVVLDDVLPREVADQAGRSVEAAIDAMARELDVTRAEYLDAVCRWSTPNPMVEQLVATAVEWLRPRVHDLLGDEAVPCRASVFRKSEEACLGTHGHQDAGYWNRPSSSRYDATTWIALATSTATAVRSGCCLALTTGPEWASRTAIGAPG